MPLLLYIKTIYNVIQKIIIISSLIHENVLIHTEHVHFWKNMFISLFHQYPMSEEINSSFHPIFNIEYCRPLLPEKIDARLQNGTKIIKLVIAIPGIFIEKEKFLTGYKVEKIIPFYDITGVIANKDNAIIQTHYDSYTFIFLEDEMKNIMLNIIIKLRRTLFSEDLYPFTIQVDPMIREGFESATYNFESESIIESRFLSLLFPSSKKQDSSTSTNDYLNTTPKISEFDLDDLDFSSNDYNSNSSIQSSSQNFEEFNIQSVKYMADILHKLKNTLKIDQTLLDNPYFKLALHALSLGNEINNLILDNIDLLSQLFNSYNKDFKTFKNIKRISFENCHFHSPTDNFVVCPIFPLSPLKDILFDNCLLDHSNFSDFIDCLLITSNLKLSVIAFNNCTFSKETYNKVCYSILNHGIFKSLRVIWFSNNTNNDDFEKQIIVESFPQHILSSNFKLNAFAFRNFTTNFSVDLIFNSKRIKFPPIIDFSGCQLSSSQMSDLKNIHQYLAFPKQKLVLSSCQFQKENVDSLLESLAKYNGLLSLDISSLHSDIFKVIITNNSKMHNLEELIIDGNEISSSDLLKKFSEFVLSQPGIKSISFSNCIRNDIMSNKDPLQHLLGGLFSQNSIEQFIISSNDEKYCLGSLLVDVLLGVFPQANNLKLLDIRAQHINFKDLKNIVLNLPAHLEQFYFDGNIIEKEDELSSIVEVLLSKELSICEWPSKIIENIKEKDMEEMEICENRFLKKFPKSHDISNDLYSTISLYNESSQTSTPQEISRENEDSSETEIYEECGIENPETYWDKHLISKMSLCNDEETPPS